MFGEVFSSNEELLSDVHHEGRGPVGPRLRLPGRGQALRRPTAPAPSRCRTSSRPTTTTSTRTRTRTACRRSSATTTWAASGTSSPGANAGADDGEMLARDRLAHSLMYFSRGMPVVYSGDEQGFTGGGDGRDKFARQDMDPSVTADLPRRRPDRHHRDRRRRQARQRPPHVRHARRAAALKRDHVALRSGAQLQRTPTRARASSPSRASTARSGSSTSSSATTPRAGRPSSPPAPPGRGFTPCGRRRRHPAHRGADGTVWVTSRARSAVYVASALPVSDSAPGITVQPTEVIDFDGADDIDGQTREAQVFEATLDRTCTPRSASSARRRRGVDLRRHRRQRPVPGDRRHRGVPAGSAVEVAAVVDDLAGHKAGAQSVEPSPSPRSRRSPAAAGGPRTTSSSTTPRARRRRRQPVGLRRPRPGSHGARTPRGTRTAWSGTARTTTALPLHQRWTLRTAQPGIGLLAVTRPGSRSAARRTGGRPVGDPRDVAPPDSGDAYTSQASAQGFVSVHVPRPDGDYDGWGLHLWGDALGRGGDPGLRRAAPAGRCRRVRRLLERPDRRRGGGLQLHRPQPQRPRR